MAGGDKTCGACKMKVPSNAKVCAFCGARFVTASNTSLFGKIFGALQFAFFGYIAGLIIDYFFINDAFQWFGYGSIGLTFAGMILGWRNGFVSEKTVY